jgi:Methyltransferase domain
MSHGLRGHDLGQWGHSLANLYEVLVAVLDAARARSVTEIGAYAGDLTRDLADWADERGGEVVAVDPYPQLALTELAEERASVSLVQQQSFEALRHIGRTDAFVIDGDHNYYTVSRELRTIAERFDDPQMPLLLLHDVLWPHARRDYYYTAESIPEDERHPMESGPIFPGTKGIARGGLPFRDVAAEEGGPSNGVLTALEDFLEANEGLRLAVVPAFYGLGVAWPSAAEWSEDLARILEPWDRNPWLERLERNRVYNLARFYNESMVLHEEIEQLREANRLKAEMLEGLGKSRAFRLAEWLHRLRARDNGVPWDEQLRRLTESDR